MTVRPQNYGDKHPSDNGDVPPGSPVSGFQERDYRVRGHRSKGIPVRPPISGTPDMRSQKPQPEPRYAWAAVILKRIDSHKYLVLRQDGKRGFAFCRSADDIYDHLPAGEQVGLIAAMEPNQWLIVSAPRRKEMPSIRVENSTAVITNMMERQIEFDSIGGQTAEDTDELAIDSGGVRVKPGFTGQYEISIMVHAEYVDPAADSSKLKLESSCQAISAATMIEIADAALLTQVERLNFFPDSGFKVYWDQSQCRANVIIQPAQSNYMLYSPAGGGPAIWSDSPKIAKTLEVGSYATQGWVKVRSSGPGAVWLGGGDGILLKVKFPDSAPGIFGENYNAQHFYADRHTPDGVKLAWTKPGVTGSVTILQPAPAYASATTVLIEVDKGIVTKMTGAVNTDNQPITFQDPAETILNKCPSF